MKATGIVKKIDDLGRIVIPKEVRKTFGIAEGDPIEIFTDDNTVVLRKYDAYTGALDRLRSAHQQIRTDDGIPAKTRDKICELLDRAAAIAREEVQPK